MNLILSCSNGINSTFIGCLNYSLTRGVCHMEHEVGTLPDDRCSSLSSPCGVVPVIEVSSNDSDIVIYPFCTLLIAFEDVHKDRKSTRLNSSHLVISYAVFCLIKKKLSN